MSIADFQVQPAQTNHPAFTLAYRIRYGQNVIVYATDHEAGKAEFDTRLVELAQGADLWILDAQFAPDEQKDRRGWGHSTHLEAVSLAVRAGVKTVILFHHDPEHDDDMLNGMAAAAAEAAAGSGTTVMMARDGLVIEIGDDPKL